MGRGVGASGSRQDNAAKLKVCAGPLLALLCIGVAAAQKHLAIPQTSVAAAPAATGPIILDVEVTDKAGNPVAGLQASDFSVFDGRKPAPIVFFYAHENSPAQPEADSAILLIDDVNVDFNSVSQERSQIEAFLRSGQGHLPVPVSIVLVTETRLEQLVAPSRDGNLLAAEFDHWNGGLRRIPEAADWGDMERWQSCMGALDKVTTFLARRAGRKQLIWVSPGWELFYSANMITTEAQQKWLMQQIVGYSDRLRQEQIVVDMVDPLGTQDEAGMMASQWQSLLKPVRKWNDAYPGDLGLQVLATQSGGQVLYASNDVAEELGKCLQDASAWYTLDIARQTTTEADTWHEVQVKANRPNLVVRTRNGYYAER